MIDNIQVVFPQEQGQLCTRDSKNLISDRLAIYGVKDGIRRLEKRTRSGLIEGIEIPRISISIN